jgi:enediyne biosynthesis protein E4
LKGAALAGAAWLLAVAFVAQDPAGLVTKAVFRDVAREASVSVDHHAAPEKHYIMESMSSGLALLDYDNDGLVDIYLTSAPQVATAGDPKAARSVLYRNLGNWRFEDVTDRAGVGYPTWPMGACTADVDGDGWQDIYVTGFGRNTYYHNNGDGTFSDLSVPAGIAARAWSMGCGFADYDRDGDLDLFVSGYVVVNMANLPVFGKGGAGMKGEGRGATCTYRGVAVQCGPRGLAGQRDLLFRNDGNGHFSEVAEAAGVHDPREAFGLGIAWFDYNEDGWPDLYVANDSHPNYLYENQKNGTFKEIGFPIGVAVSEDGGEQGSMGVAVGDYDNSGHFSLFVTNFSEEYAALYRNNGDHFTDVSFRSKIAGPSLPFVKWGTSFLDYDNDGFLDIMIVDGHVYPQVDQVPMGASAGYRQRSLLFHNRGDGRFDEVGAQSGEALLRERVGRGLVVGDLDNDGRLDVVVNDQDDQPLLLRNVLADAGHWLIVKLRGKGRNTDAIGAVVRATVGPLNMRRLVQSGSSYLSQEDKRLHFGLGRAERADLVEVLWPDGTKTRRENVTADQIVEIRQP